MNLDPRMLQVPQGNKDDPVTVGWLQSYMERFYEYHREMAEAIIAIEPVITTWSPVLSFVTPGDLNVVYAAGGQIGTSVRFGTLVIASFTIITSTFTWTTASGTAMITGLPVAAVNENVQVWVGKPIWQGITKAGYTDVTVQLGPTLDQLNISASGSGVAAANLVAADFPSGGNVILRGSLIYRCTL